MSAHPEKKRPPVSAEGPKNSLTLAKSYPVNDPPSSPPPSPVDASPEALREIALAILKADPELASIIDPVRLAALLPENLCALKIVARARLKNPTPIPVFVAADLSEEPFDL